jgi:hypothetical protein
MALKTEGINPMATALEALSIQSQIQSRDFNRRNTHAFATIGSLLNNTIARAGVELVPAPIDFRQTDLTAGNRFPMEQLLDGATTV